MNVKFRVSISTAAPCKETSGCYSTPLKLTVHCATATLSNVSKEEREKKVKEKRKKERMKKNRKKTKE
jgi:hypothetical protein